MYLRTIGRRNKDGSEVRYVQLAHNEWDPVRKCSVARVIHSFGREDRLDRAALARLVRSLSRVLEPEQALSRPRRRSLSSCARCRWAGHGRWTGCGASWASTARSSGCWRRGGWTCARSGCCSRSSPAGRWRRFRSWRAVSGWPATSRSGGWPPTRSGRTRGRCTRAMEWLLEIEARLAEQVYWTTADLLNLEVDLLFFDTASHVLRARRARLRDARRGRRGAAGVPRRRPLPSALDPLLRRVSFYLRRWAGKKYKRLGAHHAAPRRLSLRPRTRRAPARDRRSSRSCIRE